MLDQHAELAVTLQSKLQAPISWTAKDPDIDRFLDRLQGNILKYHGRNNVVFLFCRFNDGVETDALDFLRSQVERMHSAKDQLLAAQLKRHRHIKDERPFVAAFLSKSGYDYFGIPTADQPADTSFQAGMANADLGDRPASEWDRHIVDPHLMILVAVDSPDTAESETTDLLNQMGQIGDVAAGHSGQIIGNQFFNVDGQGVENFGYVDGRSQPFVLTEDIAAGGKQELPATGEMSSGYPVDQFVVPDPAIADPAAYGSYFVFRQLEQHVRAFKAREDLLTDGRDKSFPNRDSAGVGRLESGTPFELAPTDGPDDKGPANITNNFTFTTGRCPHFAHIRKVNPRTVDTRSWIMIRRGMTYGTRTDSHVDPADKTRMVLKEKPTPDELPTGGVGLLFQSYQASIPDQFETTQLNANSTGSGGIDPVIGQANSALLDWPRSWGSTEFDLEDFYSRDGKAAPEGPYITLRGGGYFFAPSLPFLRALTGL